MPTIVFAMFALAIFTRKVSDDVERNLIIKKPIQSILHIQFSTDIPLHSVCVSGRTACGKWFLTIFLNFY